MAYAQRSPAEEWHHPLIRTANRRFSRRRLMIGVGATAAIVAFPGESVLAANANANAQDSTPESAATGNDDAIQVLQDAAAAMAALETFHFDIETTRGESTVMGLTLKEISGDVRRPTDFQTEVSASIPFGSIDVKAVGIDGVFYIEDPLSADDTWIKIEAGNEIVALVNPDVVILLAVELLSDATLNGSEKYDGVEARIVTGNVDFKGVVDSIGDNPETTSLSGQLAEGPTPVTLWISDENLILGIEIEGPLLAAEGESVVRLVSFSAFNEPVEIETPQL